MKTSIKLIKFLFIDIKR